MRSKHARERKRVKSAIIILDFFHIIKNLEYYIFINKIKK